VKEEFEPEETVVTPTKEEGLSPYSEDWSMADKGTGSTRSRDRKAHPVR
jgi:hypothetical protein